MPRSDAEHYLQGSFIIVDFQKGKNFGYRLTDLEMFDYFNKPVLSDAISSGKTIKFSHNPLAYPDSFLEQEWEYIKNVLRLTDSNLVKQGEFWYVK